jgi:hypothetical protein
MTDWTNLAGDKMSTEFDRMEEDEEANWILAQQNIEQAVRKYGMSVEVATSLFGVPKPRS